MRAFVAVEISEDIRKAVAALIEDLRSYGRPVKWVEPGNLHLTLKFLGSVPDESVPRIVEILGECVRGLGPFGMELKEAGGFPSLKRPRVLFVSAEDSPKVAPELAKRLNERMTRVGVAREDRPFRSHVTIGRVRRPHPSGAMGERLAALMGHSFGSMTVDTIVLIQSRLKPTGPEYTPVERVRLPGPQSSQAVKQETDR